MILEHWTDDDCMRLYHEHMGWEPYRSMTDDVR